LCVASYINFASGTTDVFLLPLGEFIAALRQNEEKSLFLIATNAINFLARIAFVIQGESKIITFYESI